MLFIAGLLFRTKVNITIGLSAIQVALILALGAALIRQLYFNSKFQFKNYTKVFLGSTLMICLMMFPRYFYLREEGSIWWAPVVLEIIVAHCIIYIQMAVEYYTWDEKRTKWQKELIFRKEYESNDVSESKLRFTINSSMAVNPDIKIDYDNKDKSDKSMKVGASFYTAAYFGLMKANKQKFKLKDDDQFDLLYRAGFIFLIQLSFNLVLYFYSGLKPTFVRDTEINVALFFTVLILHLVCLPTARDGMTMMKYALVHHEEFNHPWAAFILGMMAFFTILVAEIVNIVNCQAKKTVVDAIAGFIGFKCIIDLPAIYMNSHEDLPIKGAIGKLTVTRSRRAQRQKVKGDGLLNFIFVCCNVFYKSVFFYFFPFATIVWPMVKSLEGNISMIN